MLRLQVKLSKRRDGRFTLGVELQCFLAMLLCELGLVLLLVEGQAFVDEGENVDRWRWDPRSYVQGELRNEKRDKNVLRFLDLNGFIELVQSIRIPLRVQQQFAAVPHHECLNGRDIWTVLTSS